MLPGRERANAIVKWMAGDKLGAEFAEPISLEDFEPDPDRLIGRAARFVFKLPLSTADLMPLLLQPTARFRSLAAPKGRKSHADHRRYDGNLLERGYHVVYREHEVNHCPGCGRTHWIIGRVSAECAFCTTALPLAEASMRSHQF